MEPILATYLRIFKFSWVLFAQFGTRLESHLSQQFGESHSEPILATYLRVIKFSWVLFAESETRVGMVVGVGVAVGVATTAASVLGVEASGPAC